MAYESYIARTKAPVREAPLIFAFHGTGGDENQFFAPTEQLFPSAGIISPRGDVSEQGAARFFRRTGEGIYDMDDLAMRTEKMTEFILAHKYSAGERPIYGFGYSNGANILASIVMRNPELFDRAALLHPLIPWSPDPEPKLKNRPILITAGQRDPICPWPMTETLAEWFTAQGALTTLAAHDGGHEIRSEEFDRLKQHLT
jgi:phospholipase/carboxylesterase